MFSEDAILLSRLDPDELLGTVSNHPIQLEDRVWPTLEHYIQAMQFDSESKQESIRLLASAEQARKAGKPGLFRRTRENWKSIRQVYMTRAVYTKCKAYPDVAEKLLSTEDHPIIERDQYDYYWGCGRDHRGDNTFGKVLMQVRDKLREEGGESSA